MNRSKYVGTARANAKLTDDIVRDMRRAYREEGLTYQAISARYHISFSQGYQVVNRLAWRHVK